MGKLERLIPIDVLQPAGELSHVLHHTKPRFQAVLVEVAEIRHVSDVRNAHLLDGEILLCPFRGKIRGLIGVLENEGGRVARET